MTVLFHNKGIEMIDLPKIVHYKSVRKAVPSFLNEPPPPVVGYKYTKTISSKNFNQKSLGKELDLDNGTKDINVVIVPQTFVMDQLDMWSLGTSGL